MSSLRAFIFKSHTEGMTEGLDRSVGSYYKTIFYAGLLQQESKLSFIRVQQLWKTAPLLNSAGHAQRQLFWTAPTPASSHARVGSNKQPHRCASLEKGFNKLPNSVPHACVCIYMAIPSTSSSYLRRFHSTAAVDLTTSQRDPYAAGCSSEMQFVAFRNFALLCGSQQSRLLECVRQFDWGQYGLALQVRL